MTLTTNDTLFAKARGAYAHLLDKQEELDQICEHLAQRLGIKKGEVMILIKAESIAGECPMTVLQLDMFDNKPGKGNVSRIV